MDEGKLARVRKLLAKAEGAATEAERDAYNGKAAELIAEYGIDEALLSAAEHRNETVANKIMKMDAPYATEKAYLLFRISAPMGVKGVQLGSGKSTRMHLFGVQSDLERTELLFTSLLLQAARWVQKVKPANPWTYDNPYGEDVAAYRRSWMRGFADEVGGRIREAEDRKRGESESGGSGVELVLFDRGKLVNQAMRDAYPRLGTIRGPQVRRGAYAAGRQAGATADIGGTRIGGNHAALSR
jgi:hypothetical protein